MMKNGSRYSYFIKLFLFIFAILIFSSFISNNHSYANDINDQTLSRIRITLNIPDTDISDMRLREVLNTEVKQGVSIGGEIILLFKQMEFGLSLKSGAYYTRYQDYYNSILDNYVIAYWQEWGLQTAIDVASEIAGSGLGIDTVASDTVGVFFEIDSILEIDNVFLDVIQTEIDSVLRDYINARQSGDDDANAWLLILPEIEGFGYLDKVHTYFNTSWDAYHLADNYPQLIDNIRQHIYAVALPKATFSASPTSGIAPLIVNFDASESSATAGQSIQSYDWDFGDGNLGWGVTATNLYNKVGTYTVKLTITDSAQLKSQTTQNIYVTSPVHARFTPPDNDPPPLAYHFDASASTDDYGHEHISSYFWDFNDGYTANTKEVDHIFTTEGFRIITLTVTDDLGYYDTHQESVIVGHQGYPTYVNGSTITGNIKFTRYGSPYIVTGNVTIAQGGTLTIEDGVTVKLNGDGWWCEAYGGVCYHTGVQIEVQGTLQAKGVSFTWADGVNQWTGIRFNGAGASNSRLEDCVIEHAGGVCEVINNGGNLCGGYMGILTMTDSSPTITGCTIKNSTAGRGIWLSNSTSVISNNVIEGVGIGIGVGDYIDYWANYAVPVKPAFPMVTGNTITNNGTGINVGSNSGGSFQGNTITNNSTGLQINGNEFGIYQGNAITGNVIGTSINYTANPLLSENIYSENTDADIYASGTINTVINWNETGASNYKTDGLNVGEGGSLTIFPDKKFVIQGSLVVAQGGTLTIEDGVTVELNGDQWVYPMGASWAYHTGVQIEVQGTLDARGVSFTWADGVNQWTGIRFNGAGASNSRLEDCVIEHAGGVCELIYSNGSYVGGYFGILTITDSSPTITGCTIKNSTADRGMWLSNSTSAISNNVIEGVGIGIGVGDYTYYWANYVVPVKPAFPIVTGNTITNNGTGIVVGTNSGGTFQGNTISGNTSYGFYYSGNFVIEATNNSWGDPSGPLDDSDDRATGGLYNPDGKGDKVSDHVNYSPWTLIGPSTTTTIPLNTTTTSVEGSTSTSIAQESTTSTIESTTTTTVENTTSTVIEDTSTTTVINDSDSDGIPDAEDNCPFTPNGSELGTCSSTSDKPGINCTTDSDCANGCSSNGLCIKDQRDSDNDGIGDVCDNCPTIPNGPQLGTCMPDSDKAGETCHSDADCVNGCSSNGKCSLNQEDAIGDGKGDVCRP